MQSCFFSTSRSSNDASEEPDPEGSIKQNKDKSIKMVPQEDFPGTFSKALLKASLLINVSLFGFTFYQRADHQT